MSDSDVQPLVTQCPNCHTQFRVGESQLQVAGGKVRCGACLTVFQGVDNLVWDGAEAPIADGTTNDDPTDLDGLLDDIDAVETGIDEAAVSSIEPQDTTEATRPGPVGTADTAAGAVVASSQDNADSVLGAAAAEASIDSVPEADTSVADVEPPPRRTLEITLDELEAQLLSGDPLELPALNEADPEASSAVDEELIPGEDLQAVKRAARETAAPAGENRTARQDTESRAPSASAAAEVVVEATDGAAAGVAAGSVSDDGAGPAGTDDGSAGHEGADAESAAAADAVPANVYDEQGDEEVAAAVAADDPFAELRADAPSAEADPFERLAAKQREAEPALPAPGRSIWPSLGIAAGVLLLIGQVLFLRFNSWTQNPQIRPVYEAVCTVFPCTVPPLKALEYMEVVKKSARSHPSVANALQIDMVIANRAPFAQTFPLLEIVFTDFNNEVVAGRRFKPSEYLAGELRGQTEIAAQTPVRVQLEIEDLGDDAINYSITFR